MARILSRQPVVIGAGVTGLAAGMASRSLVLEAARAPGGICTSYYVEPGGARRTKQPHGRAAYRFEVGGGHWIFGGDAGVLAFLTRLVPVNRYSKRAAVFFAARRLIVPYPLQHHLDHLGASVRRRVESELGRASARGARTWSEWLEGSFGPTLSKLFFTPFHERYTAGLVSQIAPQDRFKSPSASSPQPRGHGYNDTFLYPQHGLDSLVGRMASRCELELEAEVTRIDVAERALELADGSTVPYSSVVSTLPLNRALELAGLRVEAQPDPYTSVLVLNIGARKGGECSADHWLYVPDSRSGFHRVGVYSNVDDAFVPHSPACERRVSLYVERAYRGGEKPTRDEIDRYVSSAIEEVQDWGFVSSIEVADPTWIDIAYTWSWPGSSWREDALRTLTAHGIRQVGRYARWQFQGIAASIREGVAAGCSLSRQAV